VPKIWTLAGAMWRNHSRPAHGCSKSNVCYHQVGIGHLDKQRVGWPRKGVRDHECTVPDLLDGEIGGDVYALSGLGKDMARSWSTLSRASR